jgi:hypothetical protein
MRDSRDDWFYFLLGVIVGCLTVVAAYCWIFH